MLAPASLALLMLTIGQPAAPAALDRPPPPPSFDAQARVTEALAAVRPIAYRSAQADWPAIEAQARGIAATARDTVDLLPAYQAIVFGLGDEHSHLDPAQAFRDRWQARYGDRRLLPDAPLRRRSTSAFVGRTEVAGRDVALSSGRPARLLVVPRFRTQDDVSPPYANDLYAAVTSSACGYIVDLRGNAGGDMFPMVAGLSALLGEGATFTTVAANGRPPDAGMVIREGAAVIVSPPAGVDPVLTRVRAWRPQPALARAPVAVLTDGGTGSSGEAVAVMFRGRPSTRAFGERTFGVASVNEEVVLSDGVVLMITSALMTDRDGRAYLQGLTPDQPVAAGPGDPTDPEDAVVEAAATWLADQAPCADR